MLCSTVEQKLNHWSAINTDSVTNPNHSSIWAVMKNVNSIPGRSSTILLPTRRAWALNLAYGCLVSFPGFITCPEQMTYLLSEAATTNSPEITASLKWNFLLVASKLLQLTCYLQHPSCLGPPWTRSQRS